MIRKYATVALLMLSSGLGAQVVINEVALASYSYIELRNCGPATIDLSNWVVRQWTAGSGPSAPLVAGPTVTLPPGTIIEGGQLLVLEPYGNPAFSPGTLPRGLFCGVTFDWLYQERVVLVVEDAGGSGQDYFFKDSSSAGTPPGTPPPFLPANQSWSGNLYAPLGSRLSRSNDTDRDMASDFVPMWPGSPGELNAGQSMSACGVPYPYQRNRSSASLTINGVESGGFAPAVSLTSTSQAPLPLVLTSDLNSPVFEMAFQWGYGQYPAAAMQSVTTTWGQHFNLELFHPSTAFFFGGTVPAFDALPPGGLNWPLAPQVVRLSTAQVALLNPGHPDGYSLTQAVSRDVRQGINCEASGTVLQNIMSQSIQGQFANFGWNFNFYGNTYTRAFVSRYGYVSFGTALNFYGTTFMSINDLMNAPPSIAPLMALLSSMPTVNPGSEVRFWTNNTDAFEVCWRTMRSGAVGSFAQPGTSTFLLRVTPTTLTMEYDPAFGARHGIVGLHDGMGLPPTSSPDFSALPAGGLSLNAPGTIGEAFAFTNDLAGRRIRWTLDSNGAPIHVANY